MEAFFSIITSKQIRLTNAYKTNDCYELEWPFHIIEKFQIKNFNQKFITSLRESYREWVESFYNTHIACFSKDGDLLSQWRAYANDGRGVAIGFNRDYFEAIKSIENKEYEIRDVVYEAKEQEKLLEDMFSLIEPEKLKQLEEFYIKKGNKKYIDEMFHAGIILKYGMIFKNETFLEEKEVRIIHGYDQMAAEPDIFEYRVTQDDLISFVEIPINLKNKGRPIEEIVIGPKCKASFKSITHFLEQNLGVHSIGIEIKKSISSYR